MEAVVVVGVACVCAYVVVKGIVGVNTRRRAWYLKTGELILGRGYFVWGPRVRVPKVVPGSGVPVDDCSPWFVADLRQYLEEPREIPAGKHFVPQDQVTQLHETINAEHQNLDPLRRELHELEQEHAEIDVSIHSRQRELQPYEELTRRAEHIATAAKDAETRLAAEVSLTTDVVRTIVDTVGADPRVVRAADQERADREPAALAGFDVAAAVARLRERDTGDSVGEASEQ